jgi:hypothetical protein
MLIISNTKLGNSNMISTNNEKYFCNKQYEFDKY